MPCSRHFLEVVHHPHAIQAVESAYTTQFLSNRILLNLPRDSIQRSVSNVGSFTVRITLSPGRRKFTRHVIIQRGVRAKPVIILTPFTDSSASRRKLMIFLSEKASSSGCLHVAYEHITDIAVYYSTGSSSGLTGWSAKGYLNVPAME